MKYLFTLYILFGIFVTNAQKSYFNPTVNNNDINPTRVTPFSIANNEKNKQFIATNNITVVFETKNQLIINTEIGLMTTAEKSGQVLEVYRDLSVPQVMSDSAVVQHKADQVHAGFGGLDTSYTGKGVIIGIVDQGIDFNHPDFQNTDGSTRVLRYWDHTVNGPNIPSEYGFGCVWDSSDINAGTCTSLEVGTAHGSTVAGMALSNGNANGTNKGFAPEADIIVVETDFSLPNWSISIAEACDYIFKVADSLGMPAVVNLSLGSYYGSHDALDPASVMIDSLLDAKEGRIVVCSAGNSGDAGPYHVGADVDQDTSFVWMIPSPIPTAIGSPNTILAEFWVDTTEADFYYSFAADTPGPNHQKRGETPYHNLLDGATSTGEIIEEPIYNENGDLIAYGFLYRYLERGQVAGQIAVYGPGYSPIDSSDYLFRFQTYGDGHYDLWGGTDVTSSFVHSNFETNIPDSTQFPDIVYYNMPDSLQTIVDKWNCSEKVISVGNIKNRNGHIDFNGNTYTEPTSTEVGELSFSSSMGPNRSGVMKPDIVASGDVSLGSGSFSLLNNPGYYGNTDEGGFHMRNGGTSMASPAVAGIAALYLQKCSKATYADFKADLTGTGDVDNFTGNVPNYGYGYGKANALQTVLAKHESVTIDGPGGICPGSSITLSFITGMNPILINWSNGSNASNIVTTSPSEYQVTVEDNLGCVSRSAIHPVVIYSDPFVDAGSDELICPNTELTLTASGTAVNYNWNNNVINGEPFLPQEGTYIVIGTNSSGCSTSDSLEVDFLSVLPINYEEIISSIGINQTAFNVTAGDPIGGTYSGEGIIGTSFHPALAGLGNHAIVYSYIDGNGCKSSDTSYITVYDDLGLQGQENDSWRVYPSPFNSSINIEIDESVNVSFIDMLGRTVYTKNAYNPHTIELNTLEKGIYNVNISALDSDKKRSFRVIKN
jgi:subtilisin family serine protease